MLSALEAKQYRSQGYIIPNWRLPPVELGALRTALQEIIDNNPGVRPELLINAHIAQSRGEDAKGHEAFLDLAFRNDIVGWVKAVAGNDLILWGCHIFCKPADDGLGVPWHQDGHYWPIDPLATTTAWLALDDSNEENGCLRVIPGSHENQQLYPHMKEDRADAALDDRINTECFDQAAAKNIELRAGEMSLHDVFLIHGSAPNTSGKRRAGVAMRFMPASSLYNRAKYASRETAAGLGVNYANRPLWLICGQDKHGGNGPFQENPKI